MAAVGTGHSGGLSHGRHGKPRVRPILKKFGSHSEKNSLDLDRSWEEQRPTDSNTGLWSGGWAGAGDPGWAAGGTARTARDVTFSLVSDGSSTGGMSRKYSNHARSTSGTSHHSHVSIATTGSGTRGGTFVHPFQQTPRTATPPMLSYANSLTSFDNSREYSPTITEDDDHHLESPFTSTPTALHSRSHSQSNLRRPSLVSRTSSLSDIAPQQSNRANTTTTIGATSTVSTTTATSISKNSTKSRLASGLSTSKSDLNLNLSIATASTSVSTGGKSLPSATLLDTPASSSVAALPSPAMVVGVSAVTSPASSATPLSPLRSSLEIAGFPRLRTQSEVPSAVHMDLVRNKRRKFEEKEWRKQERWDQKMMRKRDRDLTREAVKKEEAAAKARKNSFNSSRVQPPSQQSAKSKSNTDLPPSTEQRKKNEVASHSEVVGAKNSAVCTNTIYNSATEKNATFPVFEQGYTGAALPVVASTQEEDMHFVSLAKRKRTSTAKARTHGAWTSFILWLRTKLLKLSRSG